MASDQVSLQFKVVKVGKVVVKVVKVVEEGLRVVVRLVPD